MSRGENVLLDSDLLFTPLAQEVCYLPFSEIPEQKHVH